MKNIQRLFSAALMIMPAAAMAAGTDDWWKPLSAINSGDTAWVMTSAALVLFMTLPGLALFYGGMVRKKNLLSTMMHSFSTAALVSVLWMAIGYSLAFTPGNAFIGGLDRVFLSGMGLDLHKEIGTVSPNAGSIPETVFMFFQMTFAIISTAIITGVICSIHAITSAIGKPSITTKMNTRSAHGGASKVGNGMLAACTTSHATTR